MNTIEGEFYSNKSVNNFADISFCGGKAVEIRTYRSYDTNQHQEGDAPTNRANPATVVTRNGDAAKDGKILVRSRSCVSPP